MKRRKINFPRIVWVTSIFALLITILIMVMDYKINYQYSNEDTNKIYFYDCNGEVCTTRTKNKKKKSYSEYKCYTTCPEYKGLINEDYAILKSNDGNILYNYKLGLTIAENYTEYKFINNEYIIATKNKLEGVIDLNNNITVNTEYNQIGYYKNKNLIGYNTDSIIVKKDNVYGIINYKNGNIVEEIKYKETDIKKLLDIIENS